MPDFTIFHLSDTHLLAGEGKHYGVTDTRAALAAVLDRASSLVAVDLVACTGDLSEDGSVESYESLKRMVEPWAAARGAAVVYAVGNHDRRDAFREVFTGSSSADDTGPIYSETTVGDARVIVLDTSVPGAGYGRLETEQLDWLYQRLAEPPPGAEVDDRDPPAGTILALHHPPVRAETTLLQSLELQNPDDLIEVIRGSDVRVVLAGHYHAALTETVAGIPVIVAPGVTNQADIFTKPGTESAIAGSGAAIVRLKASGGVRVFPFMAPISAGAEPIFHHDADTVVRIAALAGPPLAGPPLS